MGTPLRLSRNFANGLSHPRAFSQVEFGTCRLLAELFGIHRAVGVDFGYCWLRTDDGVSEVRGNVCDGMVEVTEKKNVNIFVDEEW